jgi:hypothetical protein
MFAWSVVESLPSGPSGPTVALGAIEPHALSHALQVRR